MSDGPRVAVLDVETSNLRSAVKALELMGARVTVVTRPHEAAGAGAVVLPGVGHFGEAAERLASRGLGAVASAAAAQDVPLLGICLGMQLLLDSSDEAPGARGLGLIPGTVRRLDTARKVPQIGWNPVEWSPGTPLGSLGGPARRTYYFVHSFAATPTDPAHVVGRADYGGPFVAAIARGPVAGVQFHPEKSSRAGLALIGRWLQSVRDGAERRLETST